MITCLSDPGIEFVMEAPRLPDPKPIPSVVPQEMDKHDYTLIGSM